MAHIGQKPALSLVGNLRRRLCLLEFDHRLFTFGDIRNDKDHSLVLIVRSFQAPAGQVPPEISPVVTPIVSFAVGMLDLPKAEPAHHVLTCLLFIGMNIIKIGGTDEFLQSAAEHLSHPPVSKGNWPVRGNHHDAGLRGFENDPQACFILGQELFRLFALGDISGNAQGGTDSSRAVPIRHNQGIKPERGAP